MDELGAWLASDNGFVVHAGVFIMLLLGGIGFPIPEDIPLILGGVAIAQKIAPLTTMFLVCYVGVMAGDQTMFFIGHRYGQRLLDAGARSRFFPAITDEKVAEIREGLRKRRLLYIFIGRHLFPIRSATFVCAGALRVPFFEFLLADAIAALVSVTLMMSIGWWLGDHLTPETVEHLVEQAHFYIIALVLICAFAYYLRRQMKKSETLSVSEDAATPDARDAESDTIGNVTS
ncbi:MAG: DedA family protein [Bdellovibrionales bacterium]|nr:DedA family protein [Bdellovibrionales bacterium]